MIPRKLESLDREIKSKISEAQRERDSKAISDDEYDTRFNEIMHEFEVRTAHILSHEDFLDTD